MNAHYIGGAIALLLAVSACGTDTTPRPTPAPARASLDGTVTVAGGYAVDGDFSTAFCGSVKLTVRPDGSGSVTITDGGSPGSDSRISGSASWSCSNPSR